MDKKIKILTSGPIRAKGLIYGPVLTPFMENEDTIFALLAAGVDVVEVLPDGKEVKLTVMNFKEDNGFEPDPAVVDAPAPQEEPVAEPEPAVEETVNEDAVEVTIETPVVEEPVADENVTIEPQAEKFVPEKHNDYKKNKQNGKQFSKDNK